MDGNRIGDVSNAVMRDRKTMSSDGIIVVISNIDIKNKKLLNNPNIITRGFVEVNDNAELLKTLENISKEAINKAIKTDVNYADIKSEIINELLEFINVKTGRKPIILPVIMDIKKSALV